MLIETVHGKADETSIEALPKPSTTRLRGAWRRRRSALPTWSQVPWYERDWMLTDPSHVPYWLPAEAAALYPRLVKALAEALEISKAEAARELADYCSGQRLIAGLAPATAVQLAQEARHQQRRPERFFPRGFKPVGYDACLAR